VQVLHTPGHTPEHISFLITDTKVTNQPMGIFSGDFVFVGDVGRPDLLEKAAGVSGTMRDGARDLYRSIERFRALPDYLQVWPGHGAGSACGKALGAVPQTTVGYEKLFSPAFSFKNEDDFIDYILAGQPDPPKYFAKMKYLNRDGPPILGGIPTPQKLDADRMQALLAEGVSVVDTRQAGAFSRAHIPGTFNIPFNKSFTNWAGWLLPYDKPFALIVDERTSFSVHDMARDLTLIGLENAVGYFTSDVVDSWPETQGLANMTTAQIEQQLQDSNVQVLDVRGKSEWDAGHIPGVPNIPVGYLVERQNEIPRDKKIVVHCQSGARSAIASSVLQSLGFDVVNVRGGFDEWAASRRPVERSASS
jgi:hydroxyacylglutathione hydrolase